METRLRVLIIEDTEGDLPLISARQKGEYTRFQAGGDGGRLARGAEGERMGHYSARIRIAGLQRFRSHSPVREINIDIPLIVISSAVEGETATETMRSEARNVGMLEALKQVWHTGQTQLHPATFYKDRPYSRMEGEPYV